VCNLFHIEEALFRLAAGLVAVLLAMGRWNFRPRRWQSSPLVTRTNLARKFCFCDASLESGTGVHGISSMIREPGGRCRWMASSAPPTLMSSAVANSMNCLPFGSIPRTNTGIANGNRSQRRRSLPLLAGFIRTFYMQIASQLLTFCEY
jgi:hypothetical protein